MAGDPGKMGQAAYEAVLAGDAEAFGALFDRHAADIHAYCARRTSEADAADDLLSMVFLEAWRCRDRAVLVEESLRPWLFGIARNVVRHSERSAFRYRAALTRYAAAEVPPSADLEETSPAPSMHPAWSATWPSLWRPSLAVTAMSPSCVSCTG